MNTKYIPYFWYCSEVQIVVVPVGMHDVLLGSGLVLVAEHGVCVASLGVRGWPEARRVLAVRPVVKDKER